MSYFNTTHVKGSQKQQYVSKAKQQETHVEQYFRLRPYRHHAPSEVHAHYNTWNHTSVPITSIRRAITNLTTKGVLVKTKFQKNGPHGRPEYCWMWNKNQGGQDLDDIL